MLDSKIFIFLVAMFFTHHISRKFFYWRNLRSFTVFYHHFFDCIKKSDLSGWKKPSFLSLNHLIKSHAHKYPNKNAFQCFSEYFWFPCVKSHILHLFKNLNGDFIPSHNCFFFIICIYILVGVCCGGCVLLYIKIFLTLVNLNQD